MKEKITSALLILILSISIMSLVFLGTLETAQATDETSDYTNLSSWSMFHNNPTHSGVGTGNPSLNPTVLWQYNTFEDNNGKIYSSPAIVNGVVYVSSWDFKIASKSVVTNIGNILALNASNGEIIWSYIIGPVRYSSPAVKNGLVIIGSLDGNISALNATNGKLLWAYQTDGGIESSAAVTKGTVYIGSLDGNVYALDLSTGIKLWNYTIGPVYSSPAIVNNIVYACSNNGNFYALNATNGRKSGITQLKHIPIMATISIHLQQSLME